MNPTPTIRDEDVQFSAIRAQGAGGQHVNKVSSAVHLRFDIRASSLPEKIKQRLLLARDQRISSEGVVIIKAQQFRSLEQNREAALERLRALIQSVCFEKKKRRPTKPTRSSVRKRLDGKKKRGKVKALRTHVRDA